ncbi:glycosyltransferase [Mangrovivirga cuniculi]|nr:glycosyltransferase [Mangrovivirga cuniculi]
MTKVFDYKKVSKYSIRGVKNYLKDKIPLTKADVVICDTHLHEKYFHDQFDVEYSKMGVVHVGFIPEDFNPENRASTNDNSFRVGFYGTFNPLQGVDKIVGAAKILREEKDIRFDIIGKGPLYNEINKLAKQENNLKNIHFHGLKPYDELGGMLNSFDICLGIFGDSIKTDIVIPNKIYHYAAVGKPIITKDTEGIREGFEHEKNIWLVENTSEAIAESIIKLKNDDSLRKSIADQARETAEQNYTDIGVAREFLNVLAKHDLILNKE